MKKKLWIPIIVAVIAIVAFRMNASQRDVGLPIGSNEPIKVGVATALTGFASAWGEAEKNGLNLAAKEINDKGGINGRSVALIFEDTATNAERTVSSVSKLINIDQVKYIIGPTWLDSFKGAAVLAEEKGIVMITPSSSVTAVQTPHQHANVYAVWFKSDKEAEDLAAHIAGQGKKKVAIIMQDDSFWEDFTEYFSKKGESLGLEISHVTVGADQADFRTQLAKIKNDMPDAVVFGFSSEKSAVAFFKQKKAMLPDVPFYSSEWVGDYASNPEYAGLLKRLTYIAPQAASEDFVKKYKAAYGTDPVLSASTAYDSLHILAEAIEKTDGSSAAIGTYFAKHEFDTVSFGKARFDSMGGVVGGGFVFKSL